MFDQIDDLNRFPKSQEELVYLLDRLLHRHVPFIATRCQSVVYADGLIPPLLSRLASGLSLPVYPPGREARQEIISQMATLYGLQFDDDAVAYLVRRLTVTVPRIRSFFAQFATAESPTTEVTVGDLEAWFDRTISGDLDRLQKLILDTVATEFQLTASDLQGSSRKQTISLARSIAVYFMRNLLRMSFSRIGSQLGNRDHSTIMHAFQKASRRAAETGSSDATVTRISNLELQLNEMLAANIQERASWKSC